MNATEKQVVMESGLAIDKKCSDNEVAIKILVGYHNYFRVGVFEAIKLVEKSMDAAGLDRKKWYASYSKKIDSVPDGGIRVGQVRVHHGDQSYPLYVIKR